MNKGEFPLQEASRGYDAAHSREQEALGEVTSAKEMLEGTFNSEERAIAEALITEAEQAWELALAQRDAYGKEIEEVLEGQGIEQALDYAGAVLRSEFAAQEVVAAQRRAVQAIDEVQDTKERPLTKEDRVVGKDRLADVVLEKELAGLAVSQLRAIEARVARWVRDGDLDDDRLRDQVLAVVQEESTTSRPFAWSDIKWHVN